MLSSMHVLAMSKKYKQIAFSKRKKWYSKLRENEWKIEKHMKSYKTLTFK